jgi:peptidoglycan/xylan/chitin deacetylase (PgdA/CDA1 family)
MTRRRLGALAAASVLTLMAVACGGSDEPSARTEHRTHRTHPTHATVPPTTAAPVEPPPTEPPATEPAPLAAPTPAPVPAGSLAPYGEVVAGNPDRPEMALTFDCGSVAGPTPAILQILSNRGIRSTFFLTGRWMEQNPGLTQQIAGAHELAHHTYSHGDLAGMSDAQILDEMNRTEAIFEQVAGRGTKPMWRAPFGSRNQHILQLVAGAGWPTHVFWTVDGLDWQDIPAEEVRSRILNGAHNGAIALQHCGSPQTAEVLDQLITDLQGRGLTLTTVSNLLR